MPGQSARNETQLVSAITGSITGRWPNAWCLKVHGGGFQRAGVPDLLVCVDGHLFGLEVKHQKPGESEEAMLRRVTMLQRRELRDLANAGAVSAVVWSVEQALEIIEERVGHRPQ